MIALDDLETQAAKIFDRELAIPEPDESWWEKMDDLEDAELDSQRINTIFQMRDCQAIEMGFEKIDVQELVKSATGEYPTKIENQKDRQNFEWHYNHHLHTIHTQLEANWGSFPTDYIFMHRKKWYEPPFVKTEKWRWRYGKVNHLKQEIPFDVIKRIKAVKNLYLFNAVSAVAPIEAWTVNGKRSPAIIIAHLWEIPPDANNNYTTAGKSFDYFIARW